MKSKKFKLSAIVFYSVIIVFALVLSNMAFATPLPDTGQTQSYTNTFGEDSDYSCNPHSYTDFGNGIVRDNVTGLDWQQATAPGTYTWQQALDYVAGMNSGSGTYGFTDWRLPNIKELSTLVDSGLPYPGPTINTSYFPDTVAFRYWSSTIFAGYAADAWVVYFNEGDVYYNPEYYGNCVRAVRGGQSNNRFVDNSDGTITDTSTGLMWQKATAPGTYTWEQALTYCENLTLPAGGYSDWRLPNRNELQSIVDYSQSAPTINTTFFPDTVMSYYWSSTTHAYDTTRAWSVYLSDGYVGFGYSVGGSYYVRAVRGGQCGSTPTVIELSSFAATPKAGQVILAWSTASELDNAGFNLYRSESENCQYTKINAFLITAQGSSSQGASYEFTDTNVQNRKTYYYKLEDIDLNGTSTMQGPVSATPRLIYGMKK